MPAPARADACPPSGTVICGANEPIDTQFGPVTRPYRVGTATCAKDCVCETPIARVLQSCPGEYVYVDHCAAIYGVNSTAGAAALQRKKLTWTEATFDSQVTVGTATIRSDVSIDPTFTTTSPSETAVDGKTIRSHGAAEQCVGDDSTFALSMYGGATFRFGGSAYSVLYASSNGYL